MSFLHRKPEPQLVQSNRDRDRRICMDPEIAAEIKRLGIEVISWRQFRKLTDEAAARKTAAPAEGR